MESFLTILRTMGVLNVSSWFVLSAIIILNIKVEFAIQKGGKKTKYTFRVSFRYNPLK